MPFESEFLEMMPHQVEVHSWLGQDFQGIDTYAVPHATYQCRIVGKGIALRRKEGEEDTVIFDIYADTGGAVVKIEDKIVLPADEAWIDQTPLIFAIGRYTDEFGHHHTKIQCGWMYHRQGQ